MVVHLQHTLLTGRAVVRPIRLHTLTFLAEPRPPGRADGIGYELGEFGSWEVTVSMAITPPRTGR